MCERATPFLAWANGVLGGSGFQFPWLPQQACCYLPTDCKQGFCLAPRLPNAIGLSGFRVLINLLKPSMAGSGGVSGHSDCCRSLSLCAADISHPLCWLSRFLPRHASDLPRALIFFSVRSRRGFGSCVAGGMTQIVGDDYLSQVSNPPRGATDPSRGMTNPSR